MAQNIDYPWLLRIFQKKKKIHKMISPVIFHKFTFYTEFQKSIDNVVKSPGISSEELNAKISRHIVGRATDSDHRRDATGSGDGAFANRKATSCN